MLQEIHSVLPPRPPSTRKETYDSALQAQKASKPQQSAQASSAEKNSGFEPVNGVEQQERHGTPEASRCMPAPEAVKAISPGGTSELGAACLTKKRTQNGDHTREKSPVVVRRENVDKDAQHRKKGDKSCCFRSEKNLKESSRSRKASLSVDNLCKVNAGVSKDTGSIRKGKFCSSKFQRQGPTVGGPDAKDNDKESSETKNAEVHKQSTGNSDTGGSAAVESYTPSEQREIFDAVHSLQILAKTSSPSRSSSESNCSSRVNAAST